MEEKEIPDSRAMDDEHDVAQTRETTAGAPSGFPGGAGFALVVDSNDDDRSTLVGPLSQEGFHCLEARDGENALKLLGQRPVKLGVLALELPDMSGGELAWRIKRHWPDMPLVAVSGHLATWDRDDLMDLGFARMFSKPVDREGFIRFCRQIGGKEG